MKNQETTAKTSEEQKETIFSIKTELFQLTYNDYIELSLGDNSVLIVSGFPPKDVLESTKQQILLEFQDIAGNYELKKNLQDSLRAMQLNLEMVSLEFCCKLLEHDENCEEVRKYLDEKKLYVGFTIKNYQDKAKLIRWLTSRMNAIKTQLKNLEKLVNDKKDKNKNVDTNPNRNDFIRLLVSVSTFLKFNVDFSVNAHVFAEYVQRMQEYVNEMDNKKNQLKNRK